MKNQGSEFLNKILKESGVKNDNYVVLTKLHGRWAIFSSGKTIMEVTNELTSLVERAKQNIKS